MISFSLRPLSASNAVPSRSINSSAFSDRGSAIKTGRRQLPWQPLRSNSARSANHRPPVASAFSASRAAISSPRASVPGSGRSTGRAARKSGLSSSRNPIVQSRKVSCQNATVAPARSSRKVSIRNSSSMVFEFELIRGKGREARRPDKPFANMAQEFQALEPSAVGTPAAEAPP